MASIKRRGDSWRAQVKFKGRRVTKTFAIKVKAIAWAQEQERLLEANAAGALPAKTVADALDKYRLEESPKKRGQRWEEVRLTKLKRELPFAGKQISAVTAADIAAWRDAQSTSPGTIRREMVLLTSVLSVAVKEWGWLKANPMREVRKPSSPRPRARLFSASEVDSILLHLTGSKSSQVGVVFQVALETAMRSGEIVSLTWDQVDLTRRVVHLSLTKNGDGRDVPLSARAVELFESLPSREGRVFDISDQSRDVLFRAAMKKAGVEGATFHDSRATALTRLSKRVDVLTLARIAGHRDLKSLQVYYRESAEDIAKRL